MTVSLNRPALVVWAVLMVAVAVSWWLGDGHGGARAATVAVLVVAFAKAYLVGRHFMELRAAPLPLHLLFASWCAGVCVTLTSIFLIST